MTNEWARQLKRVLTETSSPTIILYKLLSLQESYIGGAIYMKSDIEYFMHKFSILIYL